MLKRGSKARQQTVFTFFHDSRSSTILNNIRANRTNPTLAPLLAIRNALRAIKTFRSAPFTVSSTPEHLGTIKQVSIPTFDQAFSSLDRENLHTSPISRTQSAPAAAIPDVETSSQIWDHIGHVVAKELALHNPKRLQQATQKFVEKDLLDIFSNGFTGAELKLKNASYQFIKTVFTYMAEKI